MISGSNALFLVDSLVDSELAPELFESSLIGCVLAEATMPGCTIFWSFRACVGLDDLEVSLSLFPRRDRLQEFLGSGYD